MIHIAICDDETGAVEKNRAITEGALRRCGTGGKITSYTDSRSLLCDIEEDGFFFDLILLDIEMPGENGMELAERIRPWLPEVRIIFITSHLEYAIDAFSLSIFRYVPKDDLEKRLPAAIEDALRLILLEEGKVYVIRTSNRLEKIPYRDIYYIERDGKNAGIVTGGGVSKVRKSLQQVYEELEAEEFIYIDRGCIANIIHIMQIRDGFAILKNGKALPISRSHLGPVKEELSSYWGRHI